MEKSIKKRVVVSVTSDLVSDNRVHKFCLTLTDMGFSVRLVGRKLPESLPISERNYQTRRLKLFFKKGPLFYAEFNLRLYLLLLFTRADVLLSNDLDTLTANFIASKAKRISLVYDSHEYFTEVPELINRPRVQQIWEKLEKWMLPNIRYAFTVNDSIAGIYAEKYNVKFHVVRNLPMMQVFKDKKPDKVNVDKIVLYQGALNVGRGLKQAILAMKYLEKVKLVIAGKGDIKSELENLVKTENLQKKVEFTGNLPIDQVSTLTQQADLGISIEEDLGLNYRFALPNKLFDYIQAQVPVLVTNMPEMSAIVSKYKVGEIISNLEPVRLADSISDALFNVDKRNVWFENLPKAAKELTWENEEYKIREVFSIFL